MKMDELKKAYDKMQLKYGDKNLDSISDNAYIISFKVDFLDDITYNMAQEINLSFSSYYDKSLLLTNKTGEIVNNANFCNENRLSDCLESGAVSYYKRVDNNDELLLKKENYVSSSLINKDYTTVYKEDINK